MASTLKTYLSAIRQWAIGQNEPDFSATPMPRLRQIMKGVGVVRGKEGRAVKRKRPITPEILGRIHAVRSDSQFHCSDWEMFWAACCVAFFGFLRAGELTVPSIQQYDASYHLNLADVTANHPSQPTVIHLKIKASKTDPFRKGITVVLGATGKVPCPVGALVEYLQIRGKAPGPLFRLRNGNPLSKASSGFSRLCNT